MMRIMLGCSLALVVVSIADKKTITNVVTNFFNVNFPFLILATDSLRQSNFQALIVANREVVFSCSQQSAGAIRSDFAFRRDL